MCFKEKSLIADSFPHEIYRDLVLATSVVWRLALVERLVLCSLLDALLLYKTNEFGAFRVLFRASYYRAKRCCGTGNEKKNVDTLTVH